MNKIKVSIIVAIYNTSKYLKQCLDSVVNQTLKEIEIICVDDGSTDNSPEILKEYQKNDNRIVILTQENKKPGATRNNGVNIAKGEYIGFVDSDDWCELDMFEKLYNKAKETESDITMCAITTFNDNNNNKFSKSNTYSNLDIFPREYFKKTFSPQETFDFFFDICAYAVNKIYKTNFIKENKLKFAEKIFFEDTYFFYDAWFKAKRISLIKDFCYIYRMYSETSISFSKDKNKLDIIKSLRQRKKMLDKNNVYKILKKDFIKHKQKSLLYWFNKIKDRKIKILYFILMFFEMPSCILSPLKMLFRELYLLKEIFSNKDKKILFWGASIFLENFIRKYNIKNSNILGIIDKNPAKHNSFINNYQCFSPEKLKELKPDVIIISILNFAKSNQKSIQAYIDEETEAQNIKLKHL